jgi:hypothetical protein
LPPLPLLKARLLLVLVNFFCPPLADFAWTPPLFKRTSNKTEGANFTIINFFDQFVETVCFMIQGISDGKESDRIVYLHDSILARVTIVFENNFTIIF